MDEYFDFFFLDYFSGIRSLKNDFPRVNLTLQMVGANVLNLMKFLAEISSNPLEAIRQEVGTWEPWIVGVSVGVVILLATFFHKSNQ